MTAPAAVQPDPTVVITNYAAMVAGVRQRVLAYLQHYWRQLPDYSPDRVQQMLTAVVPVVQSGQRQVQTLTDAYLAQVYFAVTGEQPPRSAYGKLSAAQLIAMGLVAGALTGGEDSGSRHGAIPYGQMRSGTTPQEVYRRPFVQFWTAIKNGHDFTDAMEQGENRLTTLAATDLQLAKTHTLKNVSVELSKVVGYRRVLEGPHSCALCILASTQRYHRGDLMPIHPNCDCMVAPIFGDLDPGRTLNEQMVPDVHAAIRKDLGEDVANAAGKGYQGILITHEHGELGPVLSVRGQHFDGPSEVK